MATTGKVKIYLQFLCSSFKIKLFTRKQTDIFSELTLNRAQRFASYFLKFNVYEGPILLKTTELI